jgi:hypothetical protein
METGQCRHHTNRAWWACDKQDFSHVGMLAVLRGSSLCNKVVPVTCVGADMAPVVCGYVAFSSAGLDAARPCKTLADNSWNMLPCAGVWNTASGGWAAILGAHGICRLHS